MNQQESLTPAAKVFEQQCKRKESGKQAENSALKTTKEIQNEEYREKENQNEKKHTSLSLSLSLLFEYLSKEGWPYLRGNV